MLTDLPLELQERIVVDPQTACWLWIGRTDARGYGQLWYRKRESRAHRVVYALLRGEIKDGLTLDHLCLVKGCVNPAHLEPVTGTENTRRYFASITHCAKGHPFDERNTSTYTHVRGPGKHGPYRRCLACHREAGRQYRARVRRALDAMTATPEATS